MDRTASAVIWNPYTKGYFENPYEHLKECREQNPIHIGAHGAWMLFKHKDISEILKSNDFLTTDLSGYLKEKEPYIFKNSTTCPYLSKGTKEWPIYLNGEEHKLIRGLMGKSFKEFDLKRYVEEALVKLHDEFRGSKDLDLIEYSSFFILTIIEKLFGISNYGNIEAVKSYSNMLARCQDVYVPKQIYSKANDWFLWGKDKFEDSKYKENIEKYSEEMGVEYDEDAVYSILSLSVMAAFETSRDNISTAFYEILRNPELIEFILQADTKELNVLIEELFRYTAPQQYTIRTTTKELHIGEHKIPANSKLYLCLASANRDSDIFENPDKIIINRKPNEHLSFGTGKHICLGAQIARQEMRTCLKPMLEFLKDFTIEKNTKPIWSKQIFMRTMKSLKLTSKQAVMHHA